MNSNKPFIHLVKTPYGYYVYDVNTNNIVKVDEPIYNALNIQQKNQVEEYDIQDQYASSVINRMKQEGLLSSKKPKEIIHMQSDYLEYRLNNKIRKATLQITQQCNFRCSYCIYSEVDNPNQRTHSLKKMSFEMAKKAIDFLISHSKDQKRINIGFYGGEPLLEFQLIKKCIEYADVAGEGKEVTYSLTTNGSLLTNEIVEYFIEQNVDIMISLDGPKEIQDIQRRFSTNGCGTFDVIEKNLLRIREKYPEFFKKLKFNVVIDPQNDYDCMNNFFVNYDIFKETTVRSSIIDDIYSNEKIYYTDDYMSKRDYEIFKAFLYQHNRLDRNLVSPIALQEVDEIRKFKDKLGNMTQLPDKTAHGGPCIPGELRLFINAEGNFFPCERVSELSQMMNIGNLETGFDIEKASKLLNVGKVSEESCKNCWSINLCSLCAKHADNLKELSCNLKKSFCPGTRAQVENTIRNYIMFVEVNSIFRDHIS